ncbi:cell wall-binding repeat-containing protein [Peptacetobacter sp. AB845]|uniref:cell wall-binding repeat-containing protein n=1 Tax=Peptacetobacter sp. AB845 TaxID=3388429 RepID=UPI0039C95B9E
MKLKENLRKVIAVLISANMIFSQSSIIFAEENGDESQHSRVVDNELSKKESWAGCTECSEEKPHIIRTKEDLDKIRTHKGENKNIVTGYFKLANDIVFSETDFAKDGAFYNDGYGWIAIGKDSGTEIENRDKYFVGSFDGNNYSIENLITRNQASLVGLFGNNGSSSDRTAIIKNLTIKNSVYNKEHDKTKQNGRPMGTVAANNFATISNVTVDNSELYAVKGVVGGICGGLEGGKVENCNVLNTNAYGIYINPNQNNDGDKNGLIAGYVNNDAIISKCTVKDSSIEGSSRGTGGIVGMQYGSKILNCIVDNCRVKGTINVGGVSGGNYTAKWISSIKGCKVLNSNIKGIYEAGGIKGSVSGEGQNESTTIEDSVINNSTLSIYGNSNIKKSSVSGVWVGQDYTDAKSTINRCLVNNVTVDLSEAENTTNIAGIINFHKKGNCDISDTFVNMNITGVNDENIKVAGIANEKANITLGKNIGYVNNSTNSIKDFGDLDNSKYSISTKQEIKKEIGSNNNEIEVKEIFNTENLFKGDNILYESSNEDVLKVDGDKVLIKKNGKASILLNVIINGEKFELAKQDFNITIPESSEVVVNGNQPYNTIEDAIKDLKDNDKIELNKDVTIEETIEINKNNVLLDFKNHRLSTGKDKKLSSLLDVKSKGIVIKNAKFDTSNKNELDAIRVVGDKINHPSIVVENIEVNNAGNNKGSAIYVENASVEIRGDASVTGNTSNQTVVEIQGKDSLVVLDKDSTINKDKTPEIGNNHSDDVIMGNKTDSNDFNNENITSGGGSVPSVPSKPSKPVYTHKEVIGANRYETAAKVADELGSYDNVVLVNATSTMSDGLAASGLAGKENGAILLTKKDSIPKATMDRIKKVKKVYIIGGENAISQKVANQITAANIKVERIGGKNRVETSELVAEKLGNYSNAFIVNGFKGEADAMSASAIAARYEAPILLTNGKTSTHAKKSGVEYYVVGGTSVVNKSIADKYNAERLAGKDRYATNREVIDEFYSGSDKLYLANGETLVDALTASTIAKNHGIVLVNKKSDNSVLKDKNTVQIGGMNFEIDFDK